MRLFKFVSSQSAVLNMAKGSLKFTPIDELNDPSELAPVIDRDTVRTSLATIRTTGLTAAQFEWLICQGVVLDLLAPETRRLGTPQTLADANRILSSAVYDDYDYMAMMHSKTIQLIRSKVGVLSLSERFDSLPMWAHYADLARGFVVCFDNLERCFSGDATRSLNIPKPVSYVERFRGMTFDPSTQNDLFFSKLSDWSYEREWRVVTALRDCHRSADGLIYLRDVSLDHITGIICGWRVSDADVASLHEQLARINPGITLMSAVMDGCRVTAVNCDQRGGP